MVAEFGHIALILALALALVQGILPLIGAARGIPAWMALAPTAAMGQAVLVAFAFGCLTYAYVTSDFSVLNVAENSHTLKPMLYKVSGVWGNHEGSLLLWILILVIFGAAVAVFGRNLPATLKARVLSIQGLIGVGFLAFILFTSNPFARILPPPLEGLLLVALTLVLAFAGYELVRRVPLLRPLFGLRPRDGVEAPARDARLAGTGMRR